MRWNVGVDHGEGIDNPGLVDAVVVPSVGPVELVVRHPEPWDGSDHRQILLQEKLNRYLEHVVDGELEVAHPEVSRRGWTVVVETASEPDPRSAAYLRHAANELARSGGALVVRVAR
jgi:hypothetical protein